MEGYLEHVVVEKLGITYVQTQWNVVVSMASAVLHPLIVIVSNKLYNQLVNQVHNKLLHNSINKEYLFRSDRIHRQLHKFLDHVVMVKLAMGYALRIPSVAPSMDFAVLPSNIA